MLKVEDLYVSYGNIAAVRGISFEIKTKEIVTLIGANGAGKTSTLKSISNLIPKIGGQVIYKDENITDLEPDQIVRMGMCHIPEGRHIFPYMTVEENLKLGDFGNTKKLENRVNENLTYVYDLFPRLKERRKQNGGTLSGGEQQMLAVGRGLMLNPDIIMLDEPSLGLAPILIEQLFECLVKIRDQGKTILLIEQNANIALQIADRGYIMQTGKIIHSGKADKVINDPQVASAYLGIN